MALLRQHLRKLQPSYEQRVDGGGTSNPVMAGKSDSVHFLRLPTYDESRLNENAVDSMELLQAVVEQARNAREKRNISLRTPVKKIVAILRNPEDYIVEALTGPLKPYILQELNAWEFTVVPKSEEQEWVTLSLSPNFKMLGKKLGKKMKAVQKAVQALTHEVSFYTSLNGALDDFLPLPALVPPSLFLTTCLLASKFAGRRPMS